MTAIWALAFCLTTQLRLDDGAGKYIQHDGKLAQRLLIQDAQAGVVGRAGTEIAIEPDGAWTKTQFWGTKRRNVLSQGKLSSEEIAGLARVLNQQEASRLPREFGRTDATSNPNPHFLRLEFGDERSELFLPARMRVTDYMKSADEEDQSHARRLDAIVREVKSLAVTERKKATAERETHAATASK